MLTVTNPKALQCCVFFYVGKCFYICGGQEQRALGLANFKFVVYPGDDPNYVVNIRRTWLKESMWWPW